MTLDTDLTTILLAVGLIGLSFPLIALAFYALRLAARRRALKAKLLELNLEGEYLKVFHFAEWQTIADEKKNKTAAEMKDQRRALRGRFNTLFEERFRGDNSIGNYVVPFLLTLATTSLFAMYVWSILGSRPNANDVFTHPALFAIAGALLFAYPMFVSRYASLSLNPPTILELNGKIWLAVLIGIVATTAFKDAAQPLVAFIFSLVPVTALELLKKKAFGEKGATESAGDRQSAEDMLTIMRYDRDLLSQLNYIGVRSVLELAYENPIRLFVEADPMLISCIDLVDQANLYLYVPDKEIRQGLNRLGIRTAVDIMTQVYDEFPSRSDPTEVELRDLDPDEPLPQSLEKPMATLAKVLRLESTDEVRNLIAMMIANPQLQYVLFLWQVLGDRVEEGLDEFWSADDAKEANKAAAAARGAKELKIRDARKVRIIASAQPTSGAQSQLGGVGETSVQNSGRSKSAVKATRPEAQTDVNVQQKGEGDRSEDPSKRGGHNSGQDQAGANGASQKFTVPAETGSISSGTPPTVPVR